MKPFSVILVLIGNKQIECVDKDFNIIVLKFESLSYLFLTQTIKITVDLGLYREELLENFSTSRFYNYSKCLRQKIQEV